MFNLKELLLARGIKFRRNYSSDAEIWLCCPFCPERGEGEDTRFRLGVNVASGKGHCFNCDWKSRHTVAIIVKKLELGELQETSDVEEDKPREVYLPKDFQVLSKGETKGDGLLTRARRYLIERNLTQDQIDSKSIGASLTGKYAYRVIFPVLDKHTLVGLVARDFTGKQEPKYLNSPGMKAVYNVPRKRHGAIVLLEGVFKSLYIERVLNVPSGSLLGHTITDSQLDMIQGFSDVVLWPDPDGPGIDGFLKVALRLELRYKVWMPKVIPTLQADEMKEGEVKRIRDSFAPFSYEIELRYKKRLMELRYGN